MTAEGLSVETVRDREGFFFLRGQWNALVGRLPWATVFVTWEWMFSWWEAFSTRGRLSIVTFRGSDGGLVAVLPWYRARVAKFGIPTEAVRLIGSGVGGAEYLDVLVEPGRRHAVGRALREHWRETFGDADLFEFRDLREGGDLKGVLADAVPGLLAVTEARQTVNPCITLPARVADLERLSDRKRRGAIKDILRRERLLREREDLRYEVLTHPEDVRRGLATLVRLHQDLWGTRGRDGVFSSPAMRRFKERVAVELARQNRTRLLLLTVRGEAVGALIGYRMGDTFYYYQSGNSPAWRAHGIGKMLVHRAIALSIEEGAARFDFLRGDEPYKFDFADATTGSSCLTLARDCPRMRLFQALERSRDRLRRLRSARARTAGSTVSGAGSGRRGVS